MLKPINRISSVLFRKMFRKSKKSFSPFFRIAYTSGDNLRISVVISKKIYKKRVDRNLQKRRIIHIVKSLLDLNTNYSCIIWLQRDISQLSSAELKKELVSLFKKTPLL